MKNVYLFQPQYPVKVGDKVNYWLPYSIGCLWSFVSQFDDITEHYTLANIFYARDTHEDILEKLDDPAVCGFSTYVWNRNYNLTLAEKIKAKFPNCKIIVGGPEAHEQLTLSHYVDVVVVGEGEESFLDILRKNLAGQEIKSFYRSARVKDLSFPSPYSTDVFKDIIDARPDTEWATTLETNRGCPYGCTFCDWGSVTLSKVHQFTMDRVIGDLEWIAKNPVAYVFVADANFGILKERDLEIAEKMKIILTDSNLDYLNLTYAKSDAAAENVINISKLLGTLNRSTTVSVQSLNQKVLDSIKRKNLSRDKMSEMLDLGNKFSLPTYTEFILGLPNETKDSFKRGICEILELGQHNSMDVYFTELFVNSEMSSDHYRKAYGLKSVKAFNYLTFENGQQDEYTEYMEIINATKDMTTDEMVDAYMFGWVVANLHMNGYSQLLAKFARYVHDISFFDFYDKLYDKVVCDPVLFGHYNMVRSNIESYLKTGRFITDGFYGHTSHNFSARYFFDNKKNVYEVLESLMNDLGCYDDSIITIQKNAVYDNGVDYPMNMKANYDIENWKKINITYKIDSKVKGNFDYYSLRRGGYIRNSITKDA